MKLHLYELDHFLIVNEVALVQEDNQTGNVHLASQKHVLTSLGHRTISCSNYQDSTVHLSGTSYHVLHIVSVSRAVYVCIVTLCCFILNVRRVDSDTTFFLFRSIINLIERLDILTGTQLIVEHFRNGSCQSSLTVVDMTNCTNVHMGFGTYEFFLSHSFNFYLNK